MIRYLFLCSHGAHGLTIHFNVHMDPAKGETEADELLGVIKHEIDVAANTTESILGDLVIDRDSLEIQGAYRGASLILSSRIARPFRFSFIRQPIKTGAYLYFSPLLIALGPVK